MEKILEASQRVWGSVKTGIEKRTTLMMHVGVGAVQPKRVFRYPSPASQDLQATEHQKALHLPLKAEDLGFTKRVDREAMNKILRMNDLDPVSDTNNLWGFSFENLPPQPPLDHVVVAQRQFYDETDGVQKPYRE